jgi:hypothetical protein
MCSVAFNTCSKAFTGTHSAFKRVQSHWILTQRQSRALSAHSSALSNAHSKAFTCTQCMFKHIQSHSHLLKGVMCTHFHMAISNWVHSVTFRLTQRCLCTLKRIQMHSMLTQRHSRTLRAHLTVFSCIQCSLKGIHVHSEHIQPFSSAFSTHSKAFMHTEPHSSMFTLVQWWSHSLKGIQSGQTAKGPIDMCLNRRSMRNSYIFAPNVHWMFFKILWLDVICQQMNDVKHQFGRWEFDCWPE